MTSTADALEILTVITACHHRTAPRMDDPEVAKATAIIWSELLTPYSFSVAEYVAAVKHRAKTISDAPEVADVIRVARQLRQDATDRETDYHRADDEPSHYPGDEKAAPDPADYPHDWTSDQRTSAYWYALQIHAIPTTTKGWHAIEKQLEEHRAKRVQAMDETNV